MNTKNVTMQDIADALGISKVSVHKVFNNKTDISADLKEKVLAKAAEMNYSRVNPLIKFCRKFYFILPKKFNISTEQFYYSIYKSLNQYLTGMGTSLELKVINNDFSPSTFIKNVKSLTRESFAFFIAGQNPSSVFQEFESSDCPCICIDYHSDRYNLDYVYINNYQSAYKLTNYLISHGYKKLCFLVNINFAGTNMDKYFGFRKSLMKNGIEFTEDMHINADFAYIDLFKTMSIPEMPDALIFDSDQAAYNFMIYMMSKGYHIPENVSVASFDNTPLSKDIGLTSIGCKTMEIIEAAYELMLRRFSLPSATGQTVTLFPKIQERNTIKIK